MAAYVTRTEVSRISSHTLGAAEARQLGLGRRHPLPTATACWLTRREQGERSTLPVVGNSRPWAGYPSFKHRLPHGYRCHLYDTQPRWPWREDGSGRLAALISRSQRYVSSFGDGEGP
jgi:hypothetical protein